MGFRNQLILTARRIRTAITGRRVEIGISTDITGGVAFYTGHALETFPAVVQPGADANEATINLDGPILDILGKQPTFVLGQAKNAAGGASRAQLDADSITLHTTGTAADFLAGSDTVWPSLNLNRPGDFAELQGSQVVMRDINHGNQGLFMDEGVLKRFNGGNSTEIWHTVGAGGEPAFTNSWVDFGSASHPPVGFTKDALGFVHLRGLAKNGTAANVSIFTLPAGYRPFGGGFSYGWSQIGQSNEAICRIFVSASGTVTAVTGGSTVWVQLNGITFPTIPAS